MPANSRVSIGTSQTGPAITLIGLTQQLFPAQTATVTFTFASGANLTVTLPVQLTAGNTGGPTVDVSPSEG